MCLFSKQAATAAKGKRKAQEAGCIPKPTKAVGGKKTDRSAPRTRMSMDQKVEVLSDMDNKNTKETVADNFNCGVRKIQTIKKNREALEERPLQPKESGSPIAQGIVQRDVLLFPCHAYVWTNALTVLFLSTLFSSLFEVNAFSAFFFAESSWKYRLCW